MKQQLPHVISDALFDAIMLTDCFPFPFMSTANGVVHPRCHAGTLGYRASFDIVNTGPFYLPVSAVLAIVPGAAV